MEYLYIIKHGPFTKIGISRPLYSRMDQIQTGNPHPLASCSVLAFRSRVLSERMEQKLHKKLKPWRAEGEWFRDTLLFRLRLWWLTLFTNRRQLRVDEGELVRGQL